MNKTTANIKAALELLNVPTDAITHIVTTIEGFSSRVTHIVTTIEGFSSRVIDTIAVEEITEELSWSKGGSYGGEQLAKWFNDAVEMAF